MIGYTLPPELHTVRKKPEMDPKVMNSSEAGKAPIRASARLSSMSSTQEAQTCDARKGVECENKGEISTPLDPQVVLTKEMRGRSKSVTGLPSISEETAEDAVSRQPTAHEEKGGKPSNSKKGPKGKRKRPNVQISDETGARPLGPETAAKVLMDLEQIFLNSGGKINKGTAQEIRETISVLVKENARLNVWLAKAEGRLLERERAGANGATAAPTYAGAVKRAVAPIPVKMPGIGKGTQVPKPKMAGKNVAILSTPGVSGDPKELLKRTYAPSKDGVCIRALRACRMGSAVVITAESSKDIKKIKSSQSLKDTGFRIEVPGRRRPRLLIYDLERDQTVDEIVEKIHAFNGWTRDLGSLSDLRKEIKPAFKPGSKDPKNDREHWVVQVTPRVRNEILARGRLYMG